MPITGQMYPLVQIRMHGGNILMQPSQNNDEEQGI